MEVIHISKPNLKRDVGLIGALAFVLSTVIGSGIFFKPEAVYSATKTAGLGLLSWIIGGIISICGGLTVAELSASMPETGGIITYLKKAYGDTISYMMGWVQMIIDFPATAAALSIIFATQVISLLQIPEFYTIPIALITLIFVTLLNFISVKAVSSMQILFTVCKIVPVLLIIVFGLFFNKNESITFSISPLTQTGDNLLTALGSGLLATMFAYDGWIYIGGMAGEMKNPKRDLPIVIILGITLVLIIYVLINVAYLCVLPASSLSSTSTPGTDVANILLGSLGGKFIAVAILLSVFGSLNGYVMYGIRTPYALALDDKLPFSSWISKLGKKNGIPYNSGIIMFTVSAIMIVSGQYNQLTDLLTFTVWLFYIMVFIAVFKMRNYSKLPHNSYKVPLYPFVPLIAILGGAFIIINTVLTQPLNSAIGIILTLIGLPIFYIKRSKSYN